MNKQRFLAELSQLLSFMAEHDRAAAIRELTARFDEAGPDGEGAVIASLGTPTALAIKMAREYVPSPEPEEDELPEEQAPEEEPKAEDEIEDGAGSVPETPDGNEEASAEDALHAHKGMEPAVAPEEALDEEAELSADAAEQDDRPSAGKETAEADAGAEKDGGLEAEETSEKPAEKSAGENKLFSVPEAQRALRPEISALFGVDVSSLEAQPETEKERTPQGRRALVVLTVAGGIVLFCLALVVAAALLSPGAAGVCLAVLAGLGGIWAAPVFADALYLYGVALMALGVGLLLLFLAVWLVTAIVKPLIADIIYLYRQTGGERE